MTFTEIQTEIMDRLGLTHSTDQTRIGRAINRFYKEITSSLGIKHVSRRTTVQANCTMGVSTLQFTSAEKVVAVYNRNVSPYVQLEERTVDELRAQMPFDASDTPTQYAIQQNASDSVTILLNCVPQTAFTLYADVYATVSTLSGSDEPVFGESFHDILVHGPLIDEYLKVEKPSLSQASEKRYEKRMGELRHFIALSTTRKDYIGKQKETFFSGVHGSGGAGGGSFDGAQSWTQTGLITFDRDPSAPFAVTASSAVVTNLDADMVDGAHLATLARIGVANTGGHLLFTDATFDIGQSGATRPRHYFGSGNLTIGGNGSIGGTLGVTGVATFTVAPTFTAGLGTISVAAPVIWSNASAVVEFSGATAPEIRFSGTSGLIKSVGDLTLHIDSDANGSNSLKVLVNASTQLLNFTDAGLLSVSPTGVFTNAGMTFGLTINQGGNDDEILALKSSDVAHGMTSLAETDTFGLLKKTSAGGGLRLQGMQSTGAGSGGIHLMGVLTDAANSTKSTGGNGVIRLQASVKSGTTNTDVAANGNLVSIENHGNTRFILDADGDSHQDVGTAWTNFDDDDDIKRMDAVAVALARENDPLRQEFVKDFESRRAVIEAMPGKPLVVFNENGSHFVNMSRLSMLHHGAIRQIARELNLVREELREQLNDVKRLLADVGREGRAALPA